MGQSLPYPHAAGQANGRFAGLERVGSVPCESVELRFLPVHDLRRDAISTFFCTPVYMVGESEVIRGYRAFQDLGTRELPDLDCAMLEHALGFARTLEAAGVVAAICTSVNFETLAWSRGRAMYLEALRRLGVAHNPYLIVRIEEIPDGTPDSRLYDIVLSLRPHLRRVFVHLSERDPRLAGYGYIGATGIVTSLPPLATRPVVMAIAKSLERVCEAQSAISGIDRVENETTLDIVRAIGVRYAAGEVFGDRGLRANTLVEDIRQLMTRGRVHAPSWLSEFVWPEQRLH